jgi:hypothetical protein
MSVPGPADPTLDAADGATTLVTISCAECRAEVPISEAVVAEATDYVVYLCGLECYQRWLKSGNAATRQPNGW